jgi:hypothetical protein
MMTKQQEQQIEDFKAHRYVIFNTVAGISVMSVILEELEDSFIVGLPSRLIRQKAGSITAEPYLPELISRFYKSTLLNHVPISGTFELPYLTYLMDNGEKIGMSKHELKKIEGMIQNIIEDSDSDVVELPTGIHYVFPDVEGIH